MRKPSYKFENYAVAGFPVYASTPKSKRNIVHAHFHRDAEIIKVCEGTVEMHIGTASFCIGKGDLIFCSPFVVHEVISVTEDAVIRGFVFDPEVLGDSADFNTIRNTHLLFSADHPKRSEVSWIFDELHRIYKEMPSTFRLRIEGLLLLLVSVLTESNLFMQDGEDKTRTAPAIRYIRENYAQPLSIEELASLINLCSDSFIRIFKKEHGQTPFSYIMDFRITQALKLLSENKYSISEIAGLTGFSSTSYFSKIFKEKLGVSPVKYKKEHF